MDIINFAAQSDQGPFLNVNEDGYDFDFDTELFMILDGFGGNGRGDKCVQLLQENLKKFYCNFIIDRDSTMPFFYSPKYLPEGNALINAALNSHAEIVKSNSELELSLRAGASGIVAAKLESVVTILSVGNCRAYILRKGIISSIFTEDSFRFLSQDKYESHLKNIPLSGFGLFPDLHYQVRELRVTPGDKLLFVTDGIYGRVEEDELNACISKHALNIKHKIQELFSLANDRGNLDNQTCMILEF